MIVASSIIASWIYIVNCIAFLEFSNTIHCTRAFAVGRRSRTNKSFQISDRYKSLHTHNPNRNISSLSPEDDDNSISDDASEMPRYRSKLQRLNQVQSRRTLQGDRQEKPKLKNFESRNLSSSDQVDAISSEISSGLGFGDMTADEEYAIDSFLGGEYDRPFAADAAAPLPRHAPSEIVEIALTALRDLDVPTTDHGAAVFMRFCAPLSRQDRWGNTSGKVSDWKDIMRGSLTPTMLARRIRASEDFSVLLDWEQLDVTEGTKALPNEMLGYDSTIAFVNVAFYFGDGTAPSMCQFTLKMFNGVWLIDAAVMNKCDLFLNDDS